MSFATAPRESLSDQLIRTVPWTGTSAATSNQGAALIRAATVQLLRNPSQTEPWLTAARQRLNELASLPPGWDGAVAQPINRDVIRQLLTFVSTEAITTLRSKPELVPTYGGGVYVEWHTNAVDIIIDVTPNEVSIYAFDNETGQEFEGAVGEHTNELNSIFAKLVLGR